MLATTLTEPVLPLFLAGLLIAYGQLFRRSRNLVSQEVEPSESWTALRTSLDTGSTRNELVSLSLVLLWFVILLVYVLVRRPAMYDGLRHFLFILPPLYVFTGFAFEFLADRSPSWLYAGLVGLLLLPGLFGILQLHPYEYTYYNSFPGGTSGAFRQYETDYWLTCYQEAVKDLEQTLDGPADLYVHREAYIAGYYASQSLTVHELRGAVADVQPGDYVLVNTRTNEDRRVFKDAPPVLRIGRGAAIFCMVKQIP
jgi:hypothetical protein